MRLPLRSVVNCRTEKNQFTSASLDISEGGMMLEPSGGLAVGTEVELQFALPGIAGIVNPRATVVRRDPPDRMAVKFSELSLEDREAIQDFVAGLVKE